MNEQTSADQADAARQMKREAYKAAARPLSPEALAAAVLEERDRREKEQQAVWANAMNEVARDVSGVLDQHHVTTNRYAIVAGLMKCIGGIAMQTLEQDGLREANALMKVAKRLLGYARQQVFAAARTQRPRQGRSI